MGNTHQVILRKSRNGGLRDFGVGRQRHVTSNGSKERPQVFLLRPLEVLELVDLHLEGVQAGYIATSTKKRWRNKKRKTFIIQK